MAKNEFSRCELHTGCHSCDRKAVELVADQRTFADVAAPVTDSIAKFVFKAVPGGQMALALSIETTTVVISRIIARTVVIAIMGYSGTNPKTDNTGGNT